MNTSSRPVSSQRIVFDTPLGAHLWVALCLGMGGAVLAAGVFLGLSELLFATRWSLLESLFIGP